MGSEWKPNYEGPRRQSAVEASPGKIKLAEWIREGFPGCIPYRAPIAPHLWGRGPVIDGVKVGLVGEFGGLTSTPLLTGL